MDRDITISDLNIMQNAIHYRRWLFSHIQPHLGARVLEVGPGIGNYTEFLLDRDQVVCLELHEEAARHLQSRFGTLSHVSVLQGDIADPPRERLAAFAFDTVVCLNVLEHIRDDVGALRHLHDLLTRGGRLLLIVPAVPAVMGSVDASLGHYRRYRPGSLRAAVESGGFRIERLYYMNSLGLLGWYWNNRIVRRTEESLPQIVAYSRLVVPWLSRFEARFPPPIGLSLVCIAQRP